MKLSHTLTKKEHLVLQYMEDFLKEYDNLPTCRQLAAHFSWQSPGAAHKHVKALNKKQYIQFYTERRYRFTRLNQSQDNIQIET